MANENDKEEAPKLGESLQHIADDIAALVREGLSTKRAEYDYYFRDRAWALGVRVSAARTYEISLTVLSATSCAATAAYMVAYGFNTLAFLACAVFAFSLAIIVGSHLLTDVGYGTYVKSLDAEREYRKKKMELATGHPRIITAMAKIKRLERRCKSLTYLNNMVNVAALVYWAVGVILALASLSAVTRPLM